GGSAGAPSLGAAVRGPRPLCRTGHGTSDHRDRDRVCRRGGRDEPPAADRGTHRRAAHAARRRGGAVNMVSAPVVARERGINIAETRKDAQGAYGSYVRLIVTTEYQTRSVAGTIYSDGKPRFIQIKGISLEAEPMPHMLYTTNTDVPGYIGALGTKLGEHGVNIATF